MPVAITNLKRINSKNIRAIFSIELPSGTIFNSCLLVYHADRRSFSVTPPQIPLLNRDGSIATDHRGETRFEPAVTFRLGEARRRFQATCLDALRAAAPDLLDRGHHHVDAAE